jgi:hypothetical protein
MDRELPSLKKIPDKSRVKETDEVLTHDKALSKKVALYLCHKYTVKKPVSKIKTKLSL